MSSLTAQVDVPPEVKVTGDQAYCPLSQMQVAETFDIVDPDDTEVSSFNIQISNGYDSSFDQLRYIGTNTNIQQEWSSAEGKLKLSHVTNSTISYVDIIAAMKDVVFESTLATISGTKTFSFTPGDANYLPSTDHYYLFVSDIGISWDDARALAGTYTYYGLQGYLATITSMDEARFSGEQAAGTGWIGGSDVAQEGVWRWMTGPEAGTIFWNGGVSGSTPNFAFWNNGEPNNVGNEDYVHITDPSVGVNGSWNDLSLTGAASASNPYHPKGFIVEFGGMPSDPTLSISGESTMYVPEIKNVIPSQGCSNTSIQLEAYSDKGDVLWFDSNTSTTILHTGDTFTTPNLTSTTTYYVLASKNGCTTGVRTPVVASVIQEPKILNFVGAKICDSGNATISATSDIGQVNWYDAPVGGNLLGTSSNFTTPVISATTSYYVEAVHQGCASSPREEVIVDVVKVSPPTGNALFEFCETENKTVADLLINGTDIKWYESVSSTSVLSSTDLLQSKKYYASQTINGCESNQRFQVEVKLYETVVLPNASQIPVLEKCDDDADGDPTNGKVEFDITQNELTLLNGASASKFSFSYFEDVNRTIPITNPRAYINVVPNDQVIYFSINNVGLNRCEVQGQFNVKVNALPVVKSNIDFKNCDNDGVSDGFTEFNLESINGQLVQNPLSFSITYYLSRSNAESATGGLPTVFNNQVSSTVFARIENSSGCFDVSEVNLMVSTTSFTPGFLITMEKCESDAVKDGKEEFDLTSVTSQFLTQFPSGQNLVVHYYNTLNDAQLNTNEIVNATNYINKDPFSQVIYVRVESLDNGACFGVGAHLQLIVNPLPEVQINTPGVYCVNEPPVEMRVQNPNPNYTYSWKDENGAQIGTSDVLQVTAGGDYTVSATNLNLCESIPIDFTVEEFESANITMDDITITEVNGRYTMEIDNFNNNLGTGQYEFALDDPNGVFQSSNTFYNLIIGQHVLYVRDVNGCKTTSLVVNVLGLPLFFTPNGDGINDVWEIKGWDNSMYSSSSNIKIYDRYNRLLDTIYPSQGAWNGETLKKLNLSTDFWYVATIIDLDGNVQVMKGHFTLLR